MALYGQARADQFVLVIMTLSVGILKILVRMVGVNHITKLSLRIHDWGLIMWMISNLLPVPI